MERLSRSEIVAMIGGVLVAAGVFIKWYESVSPNAVLADERGRGVFSAWQAHGILRWILLLAAIAPFILAYIIVRQHQLSWARGEMTAVVAIAAVGLILYNGVVDRPGSPSGQIELEWGWYVALAGALLMLGGAALRSAEVERRRKPPGTI